MVEHLPSMLKSLGSSPNTIKYENELRQNAFIPKNKFTKQILHEHLQHAGCYARHRGHKDD
jgi:hypothetical protein